MFVIRLLFSSHPELALYWMIALLVAITVHEFMHAWTANYLGDPTAKYMGRISLNPLAHLDTFGTVAILLIGIGWGKPVQINERNFKNPRLGSALTSLAGPLTNLIVAALFSIPVFLGALTLSSPLYPLFVAIAELNILLMIFNLIPIPPLDGSKVLYYFLPKSVDIIKLEMYGPTILMVLLGMYLFFGLPIFNFIFTLSTNLVSTLGFPVDFYQLVWTALGQI